MTEGKHRRKKLGTHDMVYIALFVVVIVICSWIAVPVGAIPVTMQTFAIFLTIKSLGGRRGSIAVLVYLLMGAVGLPVFSGFRGGIGVLFHTTGGYILGFLPAALLMWGIEVLFGRKQWVSAISMLFGLLLCYVFGTAWFLMLYMKNTGTIGLGTVLGWCVLPFVIPDLIKAGLALVLGKRIAVLSFRSDRNLL